MIFGKSSLVVSWVREEKTQDNLVRESSTLLPYTPHLRSNPGLRAQTEELLDFTTSAFTTTHLSLSETTISTIHHSPPSSYPPSPLLLTTAPIMADGGDITRDAPSATLPPDAQAAIILLQEQLQEARTLIATLARERDAQMADQNREREVPGWRQDVDKDF